MNLQNGIWYSPYMRVYPLEGSERVAEITCYPRVEKDTAKHVYDKDTETIEDGKAVIKKVGEPLPGAFPVWIEKTGTVANKADYIYPVFIDAISGELVRVVILEARLNDKPIEIDLQQFLDGYITLPQNGILYIRYRRVFR